MATKTGTEIVPVSLEHFALATTTPAEIRELVRDNLGNQGIDPLRDLEHVKIPTGGMTVWMVPTLQGEEAVKELEGVIIHHQLARGYWPGDFSGGQPPQCSSDNAETGVGDPGGNCLTCPFAEWGSKGDGRKGQACKSIMRLFVVQPNSLLPMVIALPPTSIKPARKYLLTLLNNKLAANRVLTKFTLVKESAAIGGGNIDYARVVLTYAGPLSDADADMMAQYKDTIAPLLAARGVSAADVEAAGAE